MWIPPRVALCLLSVTAWVGTLPAQTFTFSKSETVLTFPCGPCEGFYFETLDLNGDGKTDLLINNLSTYAIYLGDGKGGFSSMPIFNSSLAGNPAHLPTFIDVNGDGNEDLVMAFSSFGNAGIGGTGGGFLVFLSDGYGNFTMTTSLGNMPAGNGWGDDPLIAADFNGDGKVDFAFLTDGGNGLNGYNTAGITVFLNRGNGKFEQQKTSWLQGDGHWVMVAGDFLGNGKQALAWTQLYQSLPRYPIQYTYGNGDGTFGAMHTYWTDAPPLGLASADLNGDRRTDLVIALDAQSPHLARIATLFAKPTGGFYWAHDVSCSTSPFGLHLIDLNHDGYLDAVYNQWEMRAGLPGGEWGYQQVVPGPTPPDGTIGLFAPLIKGGLPAFFSNSVSSQQINLQVNESK